MDLDLDDTTVLVTGASRGIGAATARTFAREGADTVVGYHERESEAERTAASAREYGSRSWPLQMDVRDPQSVETAVERIRQKEGMLGGLVLCAGLNQITAFDEVEAEEWQNVLRVNLDGAFHVLQAVRPLLVDGSSVVTVASVAAHTGAPHHAHYASAKAGLVNLTKSVARAWAPAIQVNCVAPGITRTEMGKAAIETLDEDYIDRKLLAGEFAEPEDIARWIVFVASPISQFMHGATLDVNGGRTLR